MLAGTSAAARSDLQRPSMAQDMAKGRRTEIEFMNGFIAEKGAEVGVPAPTHAMLTEVVKRVERGEIAADPANVLVNSLTDHFGNTSRTVDRAACGISSLRE